MYAKAVSRILSPGGALQATSRLMVPRGRPHSFLYCVIKGWCHLQEGSTISLDHSCAAPLRASSAVRSLRGGPSGGVNQLAEKPNGTLVAGFIVLAHLDNSDRLRVAFLLTRKSALAILRLYDAASVPLAVEAANNSGAPECWLVPIRANK